MAAPFRLLLISDRRLVPDLAAVLDRALAGVPPGTVAVMLREKDLPAAVLLDLGRPLRQVTTRREALLLVNDRPDVALALEADGVHLPVSGLTVPEVRRLLGPGALVGRSTHGPDQALAAADEGADYATFGPVFDTPSKRAFGAPVGLEALARSAHALPLYGLGGITPAEAPRVVAAGAAGCACIRAVWSAPDPSAAVRAFLEAARP